MTAAIRFLLPLLVAGLLVAMPRTDAGAGDEAPWEAELSRLLEELPGWDVKTWAETRERFAALGSKAVPALTRALSSANSQVRLRAAEALRGIGKDARGAGPALAENLIDDQLSVRAAAAVALGHVDPDRAVKTLPALLTEPLGPKDRQFIWQGLAAAGELAAPILRMELMRGRVYRHEVFAAVTELGLGGSAVLRALVGDASWHIRLWSVRATIAFAELPATLAEAIANAAQDESDAVAFAATWRMAQAVPNDPWFVPHLARLVLSPRVEVRRAATYGLAHTSPWDTSLVVPLLNSVRDPDEAVRVNSARALALFESHQAEARAALAPLLGAPEQQVRIAAAWSLVQLGDVSGAPAPSLIEAVNKYGGIGTPFRYYLRSRHLGTGGGGRKKFDVYPVVRLYGAAPALLALGPDAIAAIERAARSTEGYRRVLFVYALGRMGAHAIPALERLLHSKDLLVRNVAACCLARSGARGKAAVPLLVRLASGYDPYDPVVIEEGEDLSAEIVEEESDQLIGATSWIRESHDALIAIGAPALKALRAAGAADAVIAKRLAPVISAIEE